MSLLGCRRLSAQVHASNSGRPAAAETQGFEVKSDGRNALEGIVSTGGGRNLKTRIITSPFGLFPLCQLDKRGLAESEDLVLATQTAWPDAELVRDVSSLLLTHVSRSERSPGHTVALLVSRNSKAWIKLQRPPREKEAVD